MKKIVLFCLLIAGFASGVSGAAKKPDLTPIESEIYSFTDGNLEYTNLPQYEIMAVACRFAGIDCFTSNYNDGYAYLDQIDSMKDKYKDHKLVKLIQVAAKKGIDASGFTNLAYHIKADFSSSTVPLDPKPANLNPEWQKFSGKELYAFVNALHDFAEETPFLKFRNLYRAQYISSAQKLNDSANKYHFQQWFKDFFGYELPVTINISFINVGASFFDFSDGPNGEEDYVTYFPYGSLNLILNNYVMCYTQKYAIDSWDTVKKHYIDYMTAYRKRIDGDKFDSKSVENISSYNLACLLGSYCFGEFAHFAYEEEIPGFYENYKNVLYKSFQDENLYSAYDLIYEYEENREKYPTFKDFYPRLNEFLNKLPIEQ